MVVTGFLGNHSRFLVAVGNGRTFTRRPILLLTRHCLFQMQRCSFRFSHLTTSLLLLRWLRWISDTLFLDLSWLECGVGEVCHKRWGVLFFCESPATLTRAFFAAYSGARPSWVGTLCLEALPMVVVWLSSPKCYLLLIVFVNLLHGWRYKICQKFEN